MLITYNKMLEAQIVQQATSSSTPSGRLPSKPEPNSREQCNYIILKRGLENSKGMELEEGRLVPKTRVRRQILRLRTTL